MFDFLVEYIKPYFDGFALITAVFLVYGVNAEFRRIAVTVLAFFVVSDAFYHYFLFDLREANHWLIYWIYNSVNILVLCNLKRLGAHLVITSLIAANVLLNIVVSFYFISKFIPEWVYNTYFIPADAIALLVLGYLWMIGYGNRLLNNKINNRNLINRLFNVRHGVHFQGDLG